MQCTEQPSTRFAGKPIIWSVCTNPVGTPLYIATGGSND